MLNVESLIWASPKSPRHWNKAKWNLHKEKEKVYGAHGLCPWYLNFYPDESVCFEFVFFILQVPRVEPFVKWKVKTEFHFFTLSERCL